MTLCPSHLLGDDALLPIVPGALLERGARSQGSLMIAALGLDRSTNTKSELRCVPLHLPLPKRPYAFHHACGRTLFIRHVASREAERDANLSHLKGEARVEISLQMDLGSAGRIHSCPNVGLYQTSYAYKPLRLTPRCALSALFAYSNLLATSR